MVTATQAIGIIQARLSSERLPAKILAPIVDNQPLLSVLSQRLSAVGIDWWLATSDTRTDDVTAAWGEALGLNVYRGDEQDVLSRFGAIARATTSQWIVRVTADDPFVDSSIVGHLIGAAGAAPAHVDLIGDVSPDRQFPLGYIPEVIRRSALLRLQNELPVDEAHHREHVTSALIPHHSAPFRLSQLPRRPEWRWTVDTLEDLHMAQAAFSMVGADWRCAEYVDFVQILDQRPDIVAINGHVVQKARQDG